MGRRVGIALLVAWWASAGGAAAAEAPAHAPARDPLLATAPLPASAARAAQALRAGAAARATAPAEAAAHFAAAAEAEPAIAARARRLESEAWLAAGRPVEAEAAARAGLASAPGGSDAEAALYEALGAARRAAGDDAGARTAWREALARELPDERRAPLQLLLAESELDAGHTEAAIPLLRALWIEAPEREEAQRAEARLAQLERGRDAPLRRAADHRKRGDRLFRLQRSEAALAAYDAALAAGLAGAERAAVARRRADCLFRLRRYAEAEAAFAALGRDPEARLWRARAQARQNAVEEAVAALEALGAEGQGAISPWARQLAGQLHAGRGRTDRARALFASVVDDRAASESVASESLWWLAWSSWRAGDRAEARRRFAALAERQRDPIERLGARYWEARARGPEGEGALAAIAGAYPFSYYGWRASQRVRPAAVSPPPVPAGRRALDDGALLPARILLAAGLADEARGALRGLEGRAAGLADRLALGRLYAAAGRWSDAQGLVVRAYGERLAQGPANGPAELWRLAWPDAFADALDAGWPADARIERALVLAVMREESRYQPDAVSVTGALGLLQIMPDTGARLAREIGLADFTPARLLEPRTSLRLGSHYLDRLAARFDGALAPAVASYNAGPEPVAEWLASGPSEEDEWVESIPYAETRAYVKRVLRSRHVYRVLGP